VQCEGLLHLAGTCVHTHSAARTPAQDMAQASCHGMQAERLLVVLQGSLSMW